MPRKRGIYGVSHEGLPAEFSDLDLNWEVMANPSDDGHNGLTQLGRSRAINEGRYEKQGNLKLPLKAGVAD
jgi:hypothetical protein